ncbi:CPBP family intramembrane metalloprotease [Mucilaginibacter conchicola]|uniref:CPBP family intramembrane metalloprotease n=1 Tax=Mucilaginibacter conchicola TaxID=2303333 RepID=A0A372NTK1_9SPHI|nr:CPBP family intramembrane glutamic endopeptidase [Mucilaginibacter conchicola]RFZ92610.1 CPBP family intramembrane metalloprotease [Mucilaginibacter conchicola]
MMKSAVYQTSPARQFLYFVVIFAGVFVVFNVLGILAVGLIYGFGLIMDIARLNFSDPHSIPALYLLQIVTTTIPIFVAPVVFAAWVMRKSEEYLRVKQSFPPMLLVVAFFIMMVSSPLIEILSNINQQMVLPQWLKGIENWMKQSEESAKKVTAAILNMHNTWDCVKNVFLVGLLTAIAEEFLFRGGMQSVLIKWTKNQHAAIWITAAIFSAFHMEFYGFLPRLLLGAMFGYFVVYSGSIWPAVWGHFLNNSTAVIATYLFQTKRINLDPDDQHVFSWWQYIFSLIIIIILLLVYKKVAEGKKSPALNGEELG